MKHVLALTAVLMLFVVAGCGDSRESLAEESMSTMKDMVDTLETVKDEASAKAAKPKLQSIADKMKDIEKRQREIGMPNEKEMKELGAKYGKEMEEIQKKLMGQMMRIAFDPKIQAQLQDIDMK